VKKLVFFLWGLIYILCGCTHQDHEGHDHEVEQGHSHENKRHDPNEELENEHVHDENEEEHQHEDVHIYEEKEENENLSEEQDEHMEHDEEYGIIEIKERPFFEIIRTSGQILHAQGDEVTMTAVHEGVVVFNEKQLLGGKRVNKGDLLLSISGKALIHDNIESTYLDIKSTFEKARSNYDRALELNKDKIISDKELLDIKLEYEQAKNKFEVLKRNYSSGGQKLNASISGFIKDVFVTEGQYVVTGQPLLKISKNKRLVIKADVPQRYFHMLENIHSANFVTVYDKKLYDIKDLNGKLVSYGKASDENSLFTPVYFEIDNKGSLLSGVYVEVFLKTTELPNCIVIPKTAVLEEAGRYLLYVEDEEGFDKRYVEIDCDDGTNYHIASGLNVGEHIVTKNPYQVKLSTLSSSLPAHSHNH